MLDKKEMRALICYAGSAPEASIGSKPIGSELEPHIGHYPLKSQEFRAWNCSLQRKSGTEFYVQVLEKRTVFIGCHCDGAPRP